MIGHARTANVHREVRVTALYDPDFDAPDDPNSTWTLTLSNGEQIIWHGQAGELNPWTSTPLRFLRCAGGTMVNVDHVVHARPCG